MRRIIIGSICFAVMASGTTFTKVAGAAELTQFKSIYSANLNGAFTLTGNTNQSCSTDLGGATASCASARNFIGADSDLNNDAHVMRNTEVPIANLAPSEIFNSSTSEITVPSGSTISKAFLFWFGTLEVPSSAEFGIAPLDAANRGTVLFAGPSQDCSGGAIADCEIHGTVYTESLGAGQNGYYVAHADVTEKLKTQFSKVWKAKSDTKTALYSVGNIQGAQGIGTSAGWSLLVVYANAAEDLQHIEIKSGLALVAPRSAQNFEFTDFDSPLVGDISSSVGFIGLDGDAGTVGDSLTVRGNSSTTLTSNTVNPSDNVMNSSVSQDGARSPYLTGSSIGRSKNTFGVEADRFTLINAIDHGGDTARITFNTTSDIFYVSGIAFATPLGKSELRVSKFISGVAQGGSGSNTEVTAGDTLEYTLAIDNVGVNTATSVSLQDEFDDVYLTNVQTSNPDCAVSGSTLSCPSLGNLKPTDNPITVVVTAEVKPGTGTFSNFATAKYGGHQGLSVAVSNVVTSEYAKLSADLALELSFTKLYVQAGKLVTLRSRITNYGPGDETAPELKLTIPTGLTPNSALPSGCSQSSKIITCAAGSFGLGSGEDLAPTASVQLDITFRAKAGKSKYRVLGLVQTGNVSGDPNLANNFGNAIVGINHPPVAEKILISTISGSAAVAKSITDYISDPDLDSLEITLGKAPTAAGSLQLVGNQLIYQPTKKYFGTFTIKYFLADGRDGKASSLITIQVIPKLGPSPHKCRGFARLGC